MVIDKCGAVSGQTQKLLYHCVLTGRLTPYARHNAASAWIPVP
jgi:hypothetical protein